MHKKIVTARLIGFGFFGLYIGGLFFRNGAYSQLLLMLPFAGVAGSSLYVASIAKCPNCKAKLMRDRFGLGLAKSARHCWSCNVDFRADALPAADAAQTPKG
ncbi:hypothetical protein [Janthinobacterium fluminis]|uniref:hypothetical protein n=1 Tax=Janthinobacterium fluminis TaxID=2987524 RepID=UPI0023589137|nr:hypothetical protein [Janthinobacterium fluminis]